MNYVIDTHVVIWLSSGLERRFGKDSLRVLRRFERGMDCLHLSAASLMEIVLLEERNRIRFTGGWNGFRERTGRLPGLIIEPVTEDDIDQVRNLSALVDPYDRMIAATALRLGIPLITADERLAASKLIDVIW